MNIIGIEIGGTKLQVVLGSEQGQINERRTSRVDLAAGAVGIRRQLEADIKDLCHLTKIDGVGAGFGGPVDWMTGSICRSHQVEGWSQFPLRSWLEDLTGVRAAVDNDANVGALGETKNGAGAGRNPVFYVTLGSGVGGGVVHNGAIYHGAPPGEAEIGHIRLDRSGTIVENRCSGWAVDARIRELKRTHPESALARAASEVKSGEARFLTPAVQAGDVAAKRLLQEIGDDLAFALSHVCHLFHPEAIVLGGGLALIGEPLRAAVADALKRFLMDAFLPGPAVALSALREDAVPVGALRLVESCRRQNR